MSRDDTFETVYPRYDFAPLVEIGISLGGALKRLTSIIGRSHTDARAPVDAGVGHTA